MEAHSAICTERRYELDRRRGQRPAVGGHRARSLHLKRSPGTASKRRCRLSREMAAKTVRRGTLAEFLMDSPLRGAGLDHERQHDEPRDLRL